MILPASYANGFAPRDGQPLYPELWRGCVGAWAPCLGPTGLTLRDWSGFGNHGTLTNGPTWVSSAGRISLGFDGVDDHVAVSGFNSRITTAISISCWVNSIGSSFSSVNQSFVTEVFNGNNVCFCITGNFSPVGGFSSTKIGTGFYTGDAWKGHQQSGTWPFQVWTHVCSTFDGTTIALFINGILNSTSLPASTLPAANDGWRFGKRWDNTDVITGSMGDIRIYNRAISPNEILTLATHRDIAYEMAPRRRTSLQVAAAFNRRRRLLLGST